jgi:hypothetical protein
MTEEKNYYLNEEDNMLHECDISCNHCNKTSKNCTLCNNHDEYYFLKGNNNTCLQRKDLPPETYYFIKKIIYFFLIHVMKIVQLFQSMEILKFITV